MCIFRRELLVFGGWRLALEREMGVFGANLQYPTPLDLRIYLNENQVFSGLTRRNPVFWAVCSREERAT